MQVEAPHTPLVQDIKSRICMPTMPNDFWNDMSWLSTPIERHAILTPPTLPRGGLLGGSSAGVPKMSKLQALAAARKKKAAEQKSSTAEEVGKPMAGLAISSHDGQNDTKEPETVGARTTAQRRTYPPLKRKDSEPHTMIAPPFETAEMLPEEAPLKKPAVPEVEPAAPSDFANTMFSSSSSTPKPSSALFTLPYLSLHKPLDSSTDAFSGPSPDDVVIAAQSKGVKTTSQKK